MKRSVKTIVLLLVLALLCGSYFLVEKLTATEAVTEEEGTFALTEKTIDDLTGVSWTSDEISYHFVKTDDLWSNADDAAFPTDQDAVQDLVDDLMELEATRKLEDVESAADYGLEAPAFTVTAEWSDGTTTEYAMGDETPFGDGYYVTLSDDATVVYTVEDSLSGLFSDTLVDFAELEEIPTVENATRLVVGDSVDASYIETSSTLDANQNWYDTVTGQPLDDDSLESLLSAAESVSWAELLTASATDDELTEWSLTDDAAIAVTVYEGDEATLCLLLGTTNDDGDYYARLSGSDMVYTVSSDDVSLLTSANASAMEVIDLLPLDFSALTEATFTLDGASYTYQRAENEVTIEAYTDEETGEEVEATTEIQVTVTLNGAETDADAAETLWSLASGLTLTGDAESAAEGDVLLAISATSESGVTASVQFYACDADSYLAVTSDGRTVLTDAAAIDKIIRNVRQLG